MYNTVTPVAIKGRTKFGSIEGVIGAVDKQRPGPGGTLALSHLPSHTVGSGRGQARLLGRAVVVRCCVAGVP